MNETRIDDGFQMKKIKKNIKINNILNKNINSFTKNKTNRRISEKNKKQALPSTKDSNIYKGNCFMNINNKYFNLYHIESFDR